MDQATTTDPIRVLCVDDNPEDVAIIRRLLGQFRRANFEVSAASTTTNCIERLESDGADVLLLDHSLPGEDGVSFLRRLAASRDIPPVIVLTGRGDERLAAEAIRSGACDYFPKDGITPSNLGGALLRAIDGFRESEEHKVLDEQIVIALAAAAEGKDPTTGGHLQRLSRYAVMLGQEIGLDEAHLHFLHYGALLHDIGKLAVGYRTLRKPGPLNEEEREEIRQHPIIGERICACLWLSRHVGPIIRHHHERWDGTGYVDGLAGADIPILARVVSIVDAFDTMSSNRPYRRALPAGVVNKRLAEGAGKQWDPDIVQAFLDLVHREHLSGEVEQEHAGRHRRAA